MKALKSVQAEDRLESDQQKPAAIDPSPLLGEWINTNPTTRGLVSVVISRNGDNVVVRVFGASSPSPSDWREVTAQELYAGSAGSSDAMGFTATYDFGFLKTRLEANLSLGLLVIGNFNTFCDGSGRSNYFSREFFYHSGAWSEVASREIRKWNG